MSKLRFLVTATAVLAGGLLPACGDDPMEPETIFGLYTLVTVNGEALPFEVQPGNEIIAASIQLNSDGTYSLSSTQDLGGGGPETSTETGTFTVDGSTVTFLGERDSFTGTVSGDTLTIADNGNTFVYRKLR